MAVVVEAVLGKEKVQALLAEGHEQSALDYKSCIDISSSKWICEIAKDVGAMQAEAAGGYLVFGAEDNGTISGALTAEMASELDESKLRARLAKYFESGFELRSAVHEIEGSLVAAVYVGPSRFGFSVMNVDGEYSAGKGADKKSLFVFRAGEVYVRHGTASERWNDSDRSKIRDILVSREKERWRTELRHEMALAAEAPVNAGQITSLPSKYIDWRIDEEGFEETIVELFRRDDDIPVRRLLFRVGQDAANLLKEGPDEVETLLNRVVAIAALGLQLDREVWFHRAVDTLARVYEVARQPDGVDFPPGWATAFWIDIVARVEALGALAVRLKKWAAVAYLATRRPELRGLIDHYGSWIRHAVTMAARSNQLSEANSDLVARARKCSIGLPVLRPDLSGDSDHLTTSLCQFDALAGLAVLADQWGKDTSRFYPSFAKYYSRRSDPAFLLLINNDEARQEIFPLGDEQLADAINAIQYRSEQESPLYFSALGGTLDDRVREFVDLNKSAANPGAMH